MSCDSVSDLPDSVTGALTKGAQESFLGAFNGVWEEYSDDDDRAALVHKLTWVVFTTKYEKKDEDWVKM
jgi:cation transport regulator ChaB